MVGRVWPRRRHRGRPLNSVVSQRNMRVSVLADYDWRSKVDHAMRVLDLRSTFSDRDYGPGLKNLVVVLNCRDPSLGYKQRVRLVKKTLTLYVDVMLDLPYFLTATHEQRRARIAEQLEVDVIAVLRRRQLKNFDCDTFEHDFGEFIRHQLLGLDANRYDHLSLERAAG